MTTRLDKNDRMGEVMKKKGDGRGTRRDLNIIV